MSTTGIAKQFISTCQAQVTEVVVLLWSKMLELAHWRKLMGSHRKLPSFRPSALTLVTFLPIPVKVAPPCCPQ